jgi:hypothetical protein
MLSHGIYLMVPPEAQKSCLNTALKFADHVSFLDQIAKHAKSVDVL